MAIKEMIANIDNLKTLKQDALDRKDKPYAKELRARIDNFWQKVGTLRNNCAQEIVYKLYLLLAENEDLMNAESIKAFNLSLSEDSEDTLNWILDKFGGNGNE